MQEKERNNRNRREKTPKTKAETKTNKQGERDKLENRPEGKAKHARPGDTRQRGPSTEVNTGQEGEGEDTEKRSLKKENQGTSRSLKHSEAGWRSAEHTRGS